MTDERSPERKAFDYLDSLGVNAVYEEAIEARAKLEVHSNYLLDARTKKRNLEALRGDLEMSVAEQERGANPSLSAAAFDKHLKVALSNSSEVREVRDQLLDIQGTIETLEHEINLLNTDIKICVARMQELGGYMEFMAVIKGISEARKVREAKEKDPWA